MSLVGFLTKFTQKFKWVGIEIESSSEKHEKVKSKLRKLWLYFNMFFLAFNILGLGVYLVKRKAGVKDIANNLYPLMIQIDVIVKLVNFYVMKGQCKYLTKRIGDVNKEYPLDAQSEAKLLSKCNRIFNILMNLGYLSALSVILKYYVEMLTKGKDTFQINIDFFFNIYQSPYFEILQIELNTTLFVTCVIGPLVDIWFLCIGFFIVEYLKLIQRNMKIAISEQNEIAIIRQIDLHAEIIEWYQIVNKIISAILVSRLSTAAVVICVLGFELSVTTDPSTRVSDCVILTRITLGIFLIQYTGNLIWDQSAQVAVEVYDSNWYLLPIKTQKLLLFIMMRSQNALMIKKGIFKATLESFKNIYSSAESYIALCKSYV